MRSGAIRNDIHLALQSLDGRQHDRQAFTCGVAALDNYLKHRASQEMARGTSSVYVATPDGRTIAGFFTLSQYGMARTAFPEQVAKGLPKYEFVSATLLGRLATSLAYRGQGVGEFLLTRAVRKYCLVADQIASSTLVVDAKDEPAARFYARFGFEKLPDAPDRLFLPLKTAREI